MDSEGGGLYNWWKKRKAAKKDKPRKLKKPKPVREKKSKKKKEREKYEWEQELDSIPVNDPETDMQSADIAAETSSETDESAAYEPLSDSSDEDKGGKKDKKKKKDDSDAFCSVI